jgi:P27 family predicted phage terminase small subunit
MASTGRPRKPTRLKVLEGTVRKDRRNPNEPKPLRAPKRQVAPAWLNKDARVWWHRIRPLLVQMQVYTGADPVALGLLCDALAEYIAARQVLDDKGTTYETIGSTGTLIRRRPEWDIARDAWRRAKTMLTEFGLTPAARAKVAAGDVGPADPLEGWEKGEVAE